MTIRYDPNQKSSTLALTVRETTEGGLAVEPFLAFRIGDSTWFGVDHFLESVEYFKKTNVKYAHYKFHKNHGREG